MKKNSEDCPERVFADYDNRKVIETLNNIYVHIKNKSNPGGFPFLAELIRRLLDRWALGDDPDPWLPFSGMFKIGSFDSNIYWQPTGVFRYLWASPGDLFKRRCRCGAYSYAVDFNRWISSSWGYYSCIGCNSFYSVSTGNPSERAAKLSMSAIHVYSNKRIENYHPEPEEMLKLLILLGMKKNLCDLLENEAVQERQERT